MDFELEYGDKTPKLNEICQELYAALQPYRKAYIGSSSLQVYKNIYDCVSYRDKEWHECLRSPVLMPLSRFIGLVESFSTYQGFLEKDPEAKNLSKHITERLLNEMGASSTDTEVTVVVKYFYLLASKPETS
ncbi:uncharacterized protein si:ch211-93g23.2 [Triplophysa dalaica]|uniref:uncharacterized protein si:ch211-93g23.2 n=1 Tax=Triplophysa dalaica TaxID=1582913 RepID=UPI0024E0148D|nr:uncharacterized protein si:ch211-93g23.2 [Triplophysa dalaica]XP_056591111.1 uncharacterized protein si:ch211-93g23.2 [Triplophysa dalaica]XP_056591121.1 uncharacterized protein si:ch211-93g23.2 [Triplophysa dalaica]